MDAVLAGMKRANSDLNIIARYLPSIDRSRGADHIESVVKMIADAKSDLIVGLDISGDPRSNDENQLIENQIRKAKSLGLKVAAHIGETKESLQTASSLLSLTDRIGHGTLLAFDNISRKPFELCPSSNVISRTVPSYEKHHFGELYTRNWPLAICTDDKVRDNLFLL